MKGRALRWAGLALAGAALVFAVVLAAGFGADPGLVDSPLLGKPAPSFDLEKLDGSGRVALDDLSGDIVVVNFFASWCLECRNEHDDLVATADAFAGDGVHFVEVTYQEGADDALSYLTEAGVSEAASYVHDEGSRTAIAYGVYGIPETFFIDEEGIVVGKVIGETDALMLGATIDAIRNGETPGQQVTGDTQQSPE
jgi:cytochrome c biogenesis protein CcmG/thiol:disulfide interchange protein DsbE